MGNSVRGIFNTYLNMLGLSWPNLAMPQPDFSGHSVFGFPPPQHGPLVETVSCEATIELLPVCPSARLSQKGSLELLASVPFVRQSLQGQSSLSIRVCQTFKSCQDAFVYSGQNSHLRMPTFQPSGIRVPTLPTAMLHPPPAKGEPEC